MKNHRKQFLLAAALLLGFCTWYTRPQTFWAASGLERSSLTGLTGYAVVARTQSGVAQQERYSVDSLSPGAPEFEALLDHLEGVRCRAGLRNLLLFPQSPHTSSAGPYINLTLVSGESVCTVEFISPERLRLTPLDSSRPQHFSVADSGLQDALFRYFTEYGAKV